jgi:hypothetical protein
MIRLGVLSLLLLLVIVGSSFSPHLLASDLPGDYFPDGTIDNFSVTRWYGKYLSAMEEPSLYRLSQREPAAQVYRVTYLPPYSPYLALKLEVHSDGSGLLELKKMEQVYVHSGDSDYVPGRMVRKATFIISRKGVNEFQVLLTNIGFWHLPSRGKYTALGGLGGDMYLYEGADHGSYHVVEVPEPDNPSLISPGHYLMKLVGEREPD